MKRHTRKRGRVKKQTLLLYRGRSAGGARRGSRAGRFGDVGRRLSTRYEGYPQHTLDIVYAVTHPRSDTGLCGLFPRPDSPRRPGVPVRADANTMATCPAPKALIGARAWKPLKKRS